MGTTVTHPDASSIAPPAYSPISDRDTGAAPLETRSWSLAQRFGFRAFFTYLVLYTFPGPLSELPGTDFISAPYAALWKRVVPWFGAHILHLAKPVSIRPSGSGDKLYDWVWIAVLIAISLVVAIVWSWLDRARRSYPKLFAVVVLYVSLFLARTMFSYGFDKVIPNQFSPMEPARLTQYIGEASPGGFAWSFLGFSIAYEIFAGTAEVISGLLLLFPRTRTLGALVGAGVMTNVFMLNMSFDIPVKQYSGHLLLMCVFLAALDRERLLNVFLRARDAIPPRRVELFPAPVWKPVAMTAGVVLALWMIGGSLYGEIRGLYEFGRLAPHGPIYGIFEVENVVKNGTVQTPLLTDATLWRRLSTSKFAAMVRLATDSLVTYGIRTDTTTHTVRLANGPDSTKWIKLSYVFSDTNHLALAGRIGADSVEMALRRKPASSYLLVSRGFHWVNETPYFR
jgi:hypothetical protein